MVLLAKEAGYKVINCERGEVDQPKVCDQIIITLKELSSKGRLFPSYHINGISYSWKQDIK